MEDQAASKEFYDRFYKDASDSKFYQELNNTPETHNNHRDVARFVERYGLREKRCLDVGCGTGAFQNMVEDWTGCDLSDSVRAMIHKPFHACSATQLPFEDNAFDAAWSTATLEHITEPELALAEIRRVVKDGGLILMRPAWNCRPWAADGYNVRPYSDFNLVGKAIKASIILRDALWFRALHTLPRRFARVASRVVVKGPSRLHYGRLKPNYEQYWCADSDAAASLDPFEVILWFVSRGDRCESYESPMSQLLVRNGAIVFRVHK